MKNQGCSRLWELEPYREGRLGAGDARSFERHIGTCPVCRERLERDGQLRLLARALPREEPGELTLRRLRNRVLRDAAAGARPPTGHPRLRAGRLVVAAVVVLTGCWLLLARRGERSQLPAPVATEVMPSLTAPPPPPETMAASVTAGSGARWSQSRAEGLERVALEEGSMRVHVRPQGAGERFLVTLPDGELEVRGTTFEVSVEGAMTTQVHVEEGAVELRLAGRPARRLEATETWTAPPAAQLPPPRATVVPSGRPTPASPPATPANDAAAGYATAVALLRGGRNEEAAAAFHAFVQAQPGAVQAEDASFLEAVALARAGRLDAAGLAAEHHLASYPGSFHRQEASILAARAAARRGDCARARSTLAPWTHGAGEKNDADVLEVLGACQGH